MFSCVAARPRPRLFVPQRNPFYEIAMKHFTNNRRWLAGIVLGALAAWPLISFTRAADPATKPATAPSARPQEQIVADLQAASAELREFITSPDIFSDAKKREEIAPKAIPALKKFVATFDELATIDPMAKAQAASLHGQF